jgi:hypothetical protein
MIISILIILVINFAESQYIDIDRKVVKKYVPKSGHNIDDSSNLDKNINLLTLVIGFLGIVGMSLFALYIMCNYFTLTFLVKRLV